MNTLTHSTICFVLIAISQLGAARTASGSDDGMLGKPIQIDWRHPSKDDVYLSQSLQVTVSPAAEAPSFVFGLVDLDIEDASILMTIVHADNKFTGPEDGAMFTFNGFALIDYADALGAIQSMTLNPATSLPGMEASRI